MDSSPTILSRRPMIPLLLMYYLVLAALMPSFEEAFRYDIICWLEWTQGMMEVGLGHVYETKCNYPPVYMYFLYGFGKLMGSPETLELHIRYVRLIPLVFTFAIGLAAWRWVPKGHAYAPFFYLLNIAVLYNSVIWAQVDDIHTCLILWALYALWRQKWSWATVLIVLALNTKLQAIIFLPVLGLLYWPLLRDEWRRIPQVLGIALGTQVVILLPWILAGTVGDWWDTITSLVGYWPKVSLAAMNFWYIVMPGLSPQGTSDLALWGPLTYKTWGLLFMSLTLLPVLGGLAWQMIIRRLSLLQHASGRALILLAAAWTQLAVFFFATEMHERYGHSVLAMLFIYAVAYRRWGPYVLASIAYFLNLEEVLRRWPDILYQKTFIFENKFIAALWLLSLVWVGYEWWRHWRGLSIASDATPDQVVS